MANKSFDAYKKFNEAKFKYLDVIVSSGIIRKQFFTRCKDLNIDPYRVAMAAGIKVSTFKRCYVDVAEPQPTRSFDQEKFLKMIELVGIDVKVLIKVKPYSETYVKLKEKGIL